MIIFVSALLSWLVSVWGRNRYNRTQLFLPAAFARPRLLSARADLEQAPQGLSGNFPQTQQKVQNLLRQLSDASLETAGSIPPSSPSPFGDSSFRIDDYRRFLVGVDAWLAILESVVENGLRPAWSSSGMLPRYGGSHFHRSGDA